MSKREQLEKMQARQNYRNLWHTDLLGTISADCPYFCFTFWCSPCASYLLRKRALYDDMSRYVCCAGYMPCSGSCGERRCPEFCLCTEVACIFSIVAAIVGSPELENASELLSCISNAVYCSVCACMQTQHKVELDKRDGQFGPTQAPPQQQMSRIDQAVPASVGYTPGYAGPPAYGQPVYGQPYPPPTYPPQSYPPPGYYPAGSYPPPNYPR